MIKGAPIAFSAVCLVIASLFAFCSWQAMAWRYEAIIGNKNAVIERQEKSGQITEKENERLSRDVATLRTYRGQDAPPLKKRALILSKQIHEFTAKWKDTDDENTKANNVRAYLNRFGLRASIMRDDLDQSGQQSDSFDAVMYNFAGNYAEIKTIASEVEKLANKLPD